MSRHGHRCNRSASGWPATPLLPGRPQPFGAEFDGHGVNVAVYSSVAERIELCLFDASGQRELSRQPLPARSGDVWHGYLPDAGPGLVYGFRVHGPYVPEQGLRCNPHKLLLDPMARSICGRLRWNDALFDFRPDHSGWRPNTQDSAPFIPKAVVGAPMQRRERPPRPAIAVADTVLYELHVRGFSRLHPGLPAERRGTLAALAEPLLLDYLRALGVTALQLMPIVAFADEQALAASGRSNYWGYNPLGFCALHPPYLGAGDASELAALVDRLHAAGLELILDLVFNHSAESDARGPTLSLRGFDQPAFYRLDPQNPSRCVDASGCGNTLACDHPALVAMIHASLRWFALDLGVDGFRLDLASILGHDRDGRFDSDAALWRALLGDPALAGIKLIAEPWSLHDYQLGRFPPGMAELNDRFRDDVCGYWLGGHDAGAFATRLAGSSDLFQASGRAPSASVNFVSAHDGLTLADRVVQSRPDDRPAQRRTLARSLLGSLLLARGVPLLQAGDELSRSQAGRHNTFDEDSPLSWLDWSAVDDPARDLRGYVAGLLRLRRASSVLREDRWFDGEPLSDASDALDLGWLRSDGAAVQTSDWEAAAPQPLAALLTARLPREDGRRERLLLLCNPAISHCDFRLPAAPDLDDWLVVLDSGSERRQPGRLLAAGEGIELAPYALLVCVAADDPQHGLPPSVADRAAQAGIDCEYHDHDGHRRQVPTASLQHLLATLECVTGLPLPAADSFAAKAAPTEARDRGAPPVGAASAAIDPAADSFAAKAAPTEVRYRGAPPVGAASAANAPPYCHLPAALQSPPGCWLLATEPYALRSDDDWGIGDFGQLARLAEIAAGLGAAGLMLTPLHAPALSRPERASPYAASCRLGLNPLYIALPALAASDAPVPTYQQFLAEAGTTQRLARLRQTETVDLPIVSRLKLQGLTLLHAAFRERHLGARWSPRGEAFRRFQRQQAHWLQDYARFEALAESIAAERGRALDWQAWPAALRDVRSTAVAAFAAAHATRVECFEYLQWIAAEQWQAAAERARRAGMEIGFVSDLALGCDLDSAEVWADPQLFALDIELGAPADPFAPAGQAWGCPPWRRECLLERGLGPFRDLLDAVMRGAGALRVDHVLGLLRQFWIPRGGSAADGAYLRMPFDALLALLTERSRQHRCAVIGEDLGTIPDGLRQRLQAANVIGMRLLMFERTTDRGIRDPADNPALSLAAIGNHDLPTVRGLLGGLDLDERRERGLFADAATEAAMRQDRTALLAAWHTRDPGIAAGVPAAAVTTILHRWLATSGSRLIALRLDDLLDLPRPANLPGSPDRGPNWRRRLPITLAALQQDPRLQALAGDMAGKSIGKCSN